MTKNKNEKVSPVTRYNEGSSILFHRLRPLLPIILLMTSFQWQSCRRLQEFSPCIIVSDIPKIVCREWYVSYARIRSTIFVVIYSLSAFICPLQAVKHGWLLPQTWTEVITVNVSPITNRTYQDLWPTLHSMGSCWDRISCTRHILQCSSNKHDRSSGTMRYSVSIAMWSKLS